jgi:hypothetical protein
MTPSLAKLADECGTDKGTHQGFMPLYEKYLPADTGITLCELGVYRGQSMRLWARYFRHPNTRIMGIDINLSLVEDHNVLPFSQVELYTADQADGAVAQCLTAMRPLDVLVDDASHEGPKTKQSFEVWWPHVLPGGLYVIEDTHCSYNRDHYRTAGIPGTSGTVMEFLKTLADDVNWGIHGYDRFEPGWKDIAFVHFYPGIAFIGKKES